MKILDFWRKISNKLILKEKVFEFWRQKSTINHANYGQKLTSKNGNFCHFVRENSNILKNKDSNRRSNIFGAKIQNVTFLC